MISFDQDKDPDAKLDYRWDWADWLDENEAITDVTWLVDTGITKSDPTNTDTTATIWLTGGSIGRTYKVTCRISTNQGRIDDRTKSIRVVSR